MTELLQKRFDASAGELKTIRGAVRQAILTEGCEVESIEEVVLAIDEACQNVIRHAYGQAVCGDIEVRLERDGEILRVAIRDFADPVDPHCLDKGRELSELRPGGLGTHFMKAVMDEVHFADPRDGRGNLLRMTKRIPCWKA